MTPFYSLALCYHFPCFIIFMSMTYSDGKYRAQAMQLERLLSPTDHGCFTSILAHLKSIIRQPQKSALASEALSHHHQYHFLYHHQNRPWAWKCWLKFLIWKCFIHSLLDQWTFKIVLPRNMLRCISINFNSFFLLSCHPESEICNPRWLPVTLIVH